VGAGEGRLLDLWNSYGSKMMMENCVNLSHGDLMLACQCWRRRSEEKIGDDTLMDGRDKSNCRHLAISRIWWFSRQNAGRIAGFSCGSENHERFDWVYVKYLKNRHFAGEAHHQSELERYEWFLPGRAIQILSWWILNTLRSIFFWDVRMWGWRW
jgi:hypothetical protein